MSDNPSYIAVRQILDEVRPHLTKGDADVQLIIVGHEDTFQIASAELKSRYTAFTTTQGKLLFVANESVAAITVIPGWDDED